MPRLAGRFGFGVPTSDAGMAKGKEGVEVYAFAGLKGALLLGYVFLLTSRRKPKPKEQTAPISQKERKSSTNSKTPCQGSDDRRRRAL
jgi:hypothetical protein